MCSLEETCHLTPGPGRRVALSSQFSYLDQDNINVVVFKMHYGLNVIGSPQLERRIMSFFGLEKVLPLTTWQPQSFKVSF